MATKTGTAGNDFLLGGGPDTLIGLQGDDIFVVYSAADTVVENAGEGRDTVLTFANYALAANASIETLSTATNADTATIALTGNALSQIIVGNYGTNTLDGLGGGDALAGLRGDDLYRVYGLNDLVVENAGEGFDRISTSGDFVLSAGSSVEVIFTTFTGDTTPLFLGGNELAQAITGNNGNNLINGGGGADSLGGNGGDDTYRTFGNGEFVSESPNAGYDSVFTSGNFALPQFSSVEYISTAVQAGIAAINLIGNESVQTIVGNYGDNIIDARGGGDTVIGLRGDDLYRLYGANDFVVENAGEGNDTIVVSGNYILRAGVSVETLSTDQNSATVAINLTGNELAQTLVGNFGANLLDGGAGSDVLYGLAGADIFRFSTAIGAANVDRLVDFGNGADTIQLDPTIFTGLANGPLAASAVAYGAAAADGDDRVVYNPQTGDLSFDSDGNGSAAATRFAILPTDLAASAIAVTVAGGAGPVRITAPGTYLLGGAVGTGTDVDTTYPQATSFTFGSAFGAPINLVFGPGSYAAGRPLIGFTDGFSVGTFDFSQLGTGVTLRPTTEFLTTGGALIVAAPTFSENIPNIRPSAIIGTPFDDNIDQSLRPGVAPPLTGTRQGGSISGGAGNDTLAGAQALDGGTGNDLLIGLLAVQMTGGAGVDTFRLPINTTTPGLRTFRSPNVAADYAPTSDRIELLLNISSDLAPGALTADRFALGTQATTPDQRILYDPASGALRYDSNGSLPETDTNSALVGIFAQLPANLDLSAANFSVVPGAN